MKKFFLLSYKNFFVIIFLININLNAQNFNQKPESTWGRKEGIFSQLAIGSGLDVINSTFLNTDPNLSTHVDYKSDIFSNASYNLKFGWSASDSVFFFGPFGTNTYSLKYNLPNKSLLPTDVSSNIDYNQNVNYSSTGWSLGLLFYFSKYDFYTGIEYRYVNLNLKGIDPNNPNQITNFSYKGNGYNVTFGKEWLLTPTWGIGIGLSYVRDKLKRENDFLDHPYLGTQVTITYN